MSDRLVDDPGAVAVLAASVSEQTGIPASHVEKDFCVTEVLRSVTDAAAAGGVEAVFKGGTSLSKVFSLIERFSEDVDVLVVMTPQETKGARDRVLKSLVVGAETAVGRSIAGISATRVHSCRQAGR